MEFRWYNSPRWSLSGRMCLDNPQTFDFTYPGGLIKISQRLLSKCGGGGFPTATSTDALDRARVDSRYEVYIKG